MMVTITAKTASEYAAIRSAVTFSSRIARSSECATSIDLNHVRYTSRPRRLAPLAPVVDKLCAAAVTVLLVAIRLTPMVTAPAVVLDVLREAIAAVRERLITSRTDLDRFSELFANRIC